MADDRESLAPDSHSLGAPRWKLNALLFTLTVVCSFQAGAPIPTVSDTWYAPFEAFARTLLSPAMLLQGYQLAVPLLGILVCHEFGHYIAARLHAVPASLPYFLPLPLLSPFGTAGAVIAMSGRIRSRNALLDIGAAGPIAGLVVAIPVLVWGLAHSTIEPLRSPATQEGQSLLYWGIKRLVLGPMPEGHDVLLHPTAFAGWGGLLITMLNLFPFGQLDGGHIAYALFGKAQDQVSRWVRRGLLALFVVSLLRFGLMPAFGMPRMTVGYVIGNSLIWLLLYGMLGLLVRMGGEEHPPFEPGPLTPGRRALAWLCLVIFVGLFMPWPMAIYP
jgi:membrane-associated protease RseP (regulator of RpoE activity)